MDFAKVDANHEGFLAARMVAAESGCSKQQVGAAIWHDSYGLLGAGNNDVDKPKTYCPRELDNRESGSGYFMCQMLCGQHHHAETAAIDNAIDCVGASRLRGATLYLWGHEYSCGDCSAALGRAGIALVALPFDNRGRNVSVHTK